MFQGEHLHQHRVLHHIRKLCCLHGFSPRKGTIHANLDRCNYPTLERLEPLNSLHLLSQDVSQVLYLHPRMPFVPQVLLIPLGLRVLLGVILRLLPIHVASLLRALQIGALLQPNALLLALQQVFELLPIQPLSQPHILLSFEPLRPQFQPISPSLLPTTSWLLRLLIACELLLQPALSLARLVSLQQGGAQLLPIFGQIHYVLGKNQESHDGLGRCFGAS